MSRDISRAVSRRTMAALSGTDAEENRDRRVKKAGVRLALECAQYARRIEILEDLPLKAVSRPGSDAARAVENDFSFAESSR